MRNFRCRGPAIHGWRPTRRAACPHGCGRPTANESCGPIRPAPACSARPMARRLPTKLRTGRSAPPANRAARKPVAGEWRHPAGAVARFWRGARRACDLRLLAVRFCRRQPRRPDRGRQHRADRGAPGPGRACAARTQGAVGRRGARAGRAAERAHRQGSQPPHNRYPMTNNRRHRAKRRPGLRCSTPLTSRPPADGAARARPGKRVGDRPPARRSHTA